MKPKGKCRSFSQARSFAKALKLRSVEQWNEYCKSGKKPEDIPAYPNQVYANKGWSGMGDFLGTGNIANYQRTFRSFEDAREFVHTLEIGTVDAWENIASRGRNLPIFPAIQITNIPGEDGSAMAIGWERGKLEAI